MPEDLAARHSHLIQPRYVTVSLGPWHPRVPRKPPNYDPHRRSRANPNILRPARPARPDPAAQVDQVGVFYYPVTWLRQHGAERGSLAENQQTRAYPAKRKDLGGLTMTKRAWKLHSDILRLFERMGGLEQRIARIEGWIEGRFQEAKEGKP